MNTKFALAAAGALCALSIGAAPSLAFDDVDWYWDANVDVDVYLDVKEYIDVDPEGLAMIEARQVHIGEVWAESTVKNIDIDAAASCHHKCGGLDAGDDLAALESIATAVGNNISITSGLFEEDGDLDAGGPSVQVHLSQDQFGDVGASSYVRNISDASVESAATAVGNNVSINAGFDDVENAMVIADVSQFTWGDIYASSYVRNVEISGFGDLGDVNPVISSVATAVGNNLNISISVDD